MKALFRRPRLGARPRRSAGSPPAHLSLLRFEDRVVPALQVINLGTLHARAGVQFGTDVANFTDSDHTSNAGNFTGTIDWGDGQTSQANFTDLVAFPITDPPAVNTGASEFLARGSHTYASAGTYTIHASIQDSDGDSLHVDDTIIVTPATHYYAVGAGAGQAPEVKVYDASTGALKYDFTAYDPAFRGGVRVATADINGDGVDDIVTAAGPGGGPHVKVFDGATGNVIKSFYAYAPTFTGGVFVAVRVDPIGADIVTGAGPGGGPHVKVFTGDTLLPIASFYAYGPNFTGGVTVAAADVNGDGISDIITGAGPGGGPHVKVYDGANFSVLDSFYAYGADLAAGVTVAGGDVNGDGKADIITGTGSGGAPLVNVFSGADLSSLGSFLAYPADIRSGVNVASADVNGDGKADIVTGPGAGGTPDIKTFNGVTLALINEFTPFDPTSLGGVFVG